MNHSAKTGSRFVHEGVHTNNVEGMNSVLKRGVRRRFYQVKPRESTGGHVALMVFIENCQLSKDRPNQLAKLFCACQQMRKEGKDL